VAQGEHIWVPLVLVFSTLLIAPFRTAFYRRAHIFSGPMQASTALPLLCFCGCIVALAAFEPHVRWLENDSWWGVIISPDVPNSLRASVAFAVALGAVVLYRMLHPGKVRPEGWSAENRLRYAALGAMPPVEADGVVWGEADRAAIPYRHVGGVLLALGDPVGAASDCASAIWRLRDLAVQEGLDPAIWGAGPRLLKIYADLGLSPVKIGPDGKPLAPEHEGSTANVHYLVCKAERHLQALLPLLPELAAHVAADEGVTQPAFAGTQPSQ
jgi:phosphatidylglycerol lysyltransferase